MMKIIDMTNHSNKNHYNGLNPKKYITIHQTGNTNKGANALNHAKYINNGSSTTWHYTVDDKNIVKHFDENIQCWHCGDGKGKGNTQSIGIELCINEDGNYIKTIENGVELVKYLMNKYSIPITNVVQHNHWSGKNCPKQIREGKEGITWNDFINMIKNQSTNNILYKVQVGAFSKKENAIKLSNELKKLGYDNFINMIKNQSTNNILYKVQVGAFSKKENAIKLSNELKKLGYDNFIFTEKK